MDLLWLPFSIATMLLYGLGQVFVKEVRSGISSSSLLLLFGLNVVVMWSAYWLIFRESGSYSMETWFWAIAAAAFSGLSYITYYESLKHGKVSIVGTIAGAYAPWTVILALVFLGESMSAAEGVGVALVVASMLLFTYSAGEENKRKTELLGIGLAVCSLFLWGTSAALAKGAMTEMGNTTFIGVFAVVCPTIWTVFWLTTSRAKLEMPTMNRGLLEIALLFIALGGITMYLAIENGPVSIVMPVTNLYPIVTIVFAKIRLKERLTTVQAIALCMILLSILLFSL